MSRTPVPDVPAATRPDAGDATATLTAGLERCRALVEEARRRALAARHGSHTRLVAMRVAPHEPPTGAQAGVQAGVQAGAQAGAQAEQLAALQQRIERAQQARAAAAHDAAATPDEVDPPVFADAPTVPRVPRGVAPDVWDALRASLAHDAPVTLALHPGAFRDPTPRTLTGRLARLEFDTRGRPHVTLVVRPGVAHRVLVATIAWVTAVAEP